MSDQLSNPNPLKDLIKIEDIIKAALKIPGVTIKRDKFLRNAFRKVCNQNIIEKAVKTSPKEAGIDDMVIDRVAEQTITNETNKVSAISFVSGLPGGFAMAGTIPADLAQYFAHIIIVAQELGYIYGWREICSVENELSPEAASLLIMFIGIMFEVEGVAGTLGKIAYSTIAKTTGEQITKLAGIKFLQELLKKIGIQFNQKVLGQALSKSLPLIGGFLSGGITYVTFRPMCRKLKATLSEFQKDIKIIDYDKLEANTENVSYDYEYENYEDEEKDEKEENEEEDEEEEEDKEVGYVKIWDCGLYRYVWKKKTTD